MAVQMFLVAGQFYVYGGSVSSVPLAWLVYCFKQASQATSITSYKQAAHLLLQAYLQVHVIKRHREQALVKAVT